MKFFEEEFVFFTGAGISFASPSDNPTAKQVNNVILNTLIESSSFKNKKELFNVINKENVKMETFFELFLRSGYSDILNILKVLNYSEPNEDHYSIAYLCKIGICKAIFTLNFDNLHEKALNKLGVKNKPLMTEKDFDNYTFDEKIIPIFHLHNGILDEDIDTSYLNAAISNVSTELSKSKEKIFKEIIKKYPVFCVGYSNNDVDTYKIIHNEAKFIYWYSHFENEELGNQVKSTIKNKSDIFIHFIRNKNIENTFTDFLKNKLPSTISKYLIFALEPSILSIKEKNNKIKVFISRKLKTEIEANILIIDLLDIINQRNFALQLIDENEILSNITYEKDQINIARVLGHLYDRQGESKKAVKYLKILVQKTENQDKNKYSILLASANLGIWKRNPFLLNYLINFYFGLKKIRKNIKKEKVYQDKYMFEIFKLFNFEVADVIDFFANGIFSISTLLLRFRKNKKSITYSTSLWYQKNAIIKLIEICELNFFLINYLRRKAIKYYLNVLDDKSILEGYVYLCASRIIENYIYLGKIEEAEKYIEYLEDGIRYYQLSSELHGEGNMYIIYALYYFIKNNDKYIDYLKKSFEFYREHNSGLIKAKSIQTKILFLQQRKIH